MTKKLMTKKLIPALALLLCPLPSRADLIKQGAAYTRTVLMTSSSDHITGAVGLTLTVRVAKAGGAYTAAPDAVTEQGNGRYAVSLVAGDTGTLGALDMVITAAGADPSDTHDQVVAFDPNDAAALGLTQVAKIGTPAGDSPSAQAAQTQATANGTALTALRTDYTTARATKLDNLDVATSTRQPSGAVALQPGQSVTASNFVAAPALPGDFLSTAEQTSLTAAAAQSAAANAGINTANNALAVLPALAAAAVFSTTLVTIPAGHTTGGTAALPLTYRQWVALLGAVPASDNLSTIPVANGTSTTSYYLAGQTPGPATLAYTSTVTYDVGKNQVSRTVKINSSFPAVN